MEKKTCKVTIYIDKELKEQAEVILNDLSLDWNTFFNMAIKELIRRGEIPFEIEE